MQQYCMAESGGGCRSPASNAACSWSSWPWFVASILSSRLLWTRRTRPNAAAEIVIANASVAMIVSRTRTVCGHQVRRGASSSTTSSVIGEELVARAAHGLDRLDAERRVDLLPQVADVHLDHVRVAGEVDAPHVVEDLR